jgi:hypothetical protein
MGWRRLGDLLAGIVSRRELLLSPMQLRQLYFEALKPVQLPKHLLIQCRHSIL